MLKKAQFLMAILISLIAFTNTRSQNKTSDQQMIAYAKNLQVAQIDPSLPSQHLDPWLRSLIGNAPQQWQIAECATQLDTAVRVENPAVCSKLFSQLPDGRRLELWIAIGSRKTGARGPATLWLAYFGVPGQEKPAAKLSDLPELVKSTVGRQPI